MPEISGKVEIKNSEGFITTITLDGDNGTISALGGNVILHDMKGTERVRIDPNGHVQLQDNTGKTVLEIFDTGDAPTRLCGLNLGTDKKPGVMRLRDDVGHDSLILDGSNSLININDLESGTKRVQIGYLGKDRTFGTPLFGIKLTGKDGQEIVHLGGNDGSMTLHDSAGNEVLSYNAGRGMVVGATGRSGNLSILDPKGQASITLGYSVDGSIINLGGGSLPGKIVLRNEIGGNAIVLDGANNSMILRNKSGNNSMHLDANTGDIILHDQDGKHSFAMHGKLGDYAGMLIGAATYDAGGTKAGYLEIRNTSGNPSMILNGTNNSVAILNEAGENKIILDGASGDIILSNADCAEDFDVCDPLGIDPGTVMVIEEDGKLQQSSKAYDRRVAGVVSGAGNFKPGLVLDKRQTHRSRRSISLIGKVYCKVDAQFSSVEIGDLLTSSETRGHAMKAIDPIKSFGSVIGKALASLKTGKGMIPILIALQ